MMNFYSKTNISSEGMKLEYYGNFEKNAKTQRQKIIAKVNISYFNKNRSEMNNFT